MSLERLWHEMKGRAASLLEICAHEHAICLFIHTWTLCSYYIFEILSHKQTHAHTHTSQRNAVNAGFAGIHGVVLTGAYVIRSQCIDHLWMPCILLAWSRDMIYALPQDFNPQMENRIHKGKTELACSLQNLRAHHF